MDGRTGEDERLARARQLHEDAVFRGDGAAVPAAHAALDSLEADLLLARARILHASFLSHREEDPRQLESIERAVRLYREGGDVGGEAQALFCQGIVYQVVRGETAPAVPLLQRSYDLAQQVDDRLTMSYAVRHLGFADLAQDRLDAGREKLEESLSLRRELGFAPGVAAALLAVAEVAARQGRRDDAVRLLDEATAVATECGAAGIQHWIDEARSELASAG